MDKQQVGYNSLNIFVVHTALTVEWKLIYWWAWKTMQIARALRILIKEKRTNHLGWWGFQVGLVVPTLVLYLVYNSGIRKSAGSWERFSEKWIWIAESGLNEDGILRGIADKASVEF